MAVRGGTLHPCLEARTSWAEQGVGQWSWLCKLQAMHVLWAASAAGLRHGIFLARARPWAMLLSSGQDRAGLPESVVFCVVCGKRAVGCRWHGRLGLGDSIGMGQGLALHIMLHGQGYTLDKLFGLPDCWARLVVGWSMCNKLCTCVPQVAATWGGSYQSVYAVGLLAASRDDTNTVIRLCLGRGLPKFKYYY
uniref:Uncharacterized protein n=1 Tax=Fagus sylvatica TaxID=28930 RepID=A0A2N9I098_FAGSY